MWKFSWILQSDWRIEFLETLSSRSGKLRRVAAAAAGRTPNASGMSFSQCTVITLLPLLPLVAKPNLYLCIKLVKKGYKTNIPSFYFERIVEITHLRRTGNFYIFPRGFAPRKNRNMPVLLRYIIPTILSQSLVYLYTIQNSLYFKLIYNYFIFTQNTSDFWAFFWKHAYWKSHIFEIKLWMKFNQGRIQDLNIEGAQKMRSAHHERETRNPFSEGLGP